MDTMHRALWVSQAMPVKSGRNSPYHALRVQNRERKLQE